MYKMKIEVVPVIKEATLTISKSLGKYMGNIQKSSKSRHYRKHPYWALYTYFRKY